METLKAYLSGPILGKTWTEASIWRLQAEEELKPYYECLNPVGDEMPWPGVITNDLIPAQHSVWTLRRDLDWVERADVVLVNTDRWTSVGTIIEMGWAFALKIPIVVAGPQPDHHWLRQMVLVRFDELRCALRSLTEPVTVGYLTHARKNRYFLK
mgnify:CR=1 FL=1